MTRAANLPTLSAAKLLAELERRDAAHGALLDETIAAGYGDTRHNEIARLARAEGWPLLVEYMAAYDALSAVRNELDSRRRWHGSDRPIKPRLLYA